MGSMSVAQKSSYVQEVARGYVQTSAPCNNYMQKQKYWKISDFIWWANYLKF